MSDQRKIYASEGERYEALVSREDYQNNIGRALDEIVRVDGLDVIDLGAGTGRLAVLLAGRVRSIRAFDLSRNMLAVARARLQEAAPDRSLCALADHRALPVAPASADAVVSGWSVSYLAVWNPESWRAELARWMDEVRRVIRRGGTLVVIESLGTGNDAPMRLPQLENMYGWLDEMGFENRWIRTDYQFDSVEQAMDLAGFFFGEEMAERVRRSASVILPECTGLFWKRL